MWPIPSWLTETLNGWLMLMIPWTIITATAYLNRRRQIYASFRLFYRQNKMAIALLFIFVGVETRTIVAWAVRHVTDRPEFYDVELLQDLRPLFSIGFTVGAILIVVGAICWARVARDIPLARPSVWIVAAFSLVASGCFALYSPF